MRRVDNMVLSPVKRGQERPKRSLENIFERDLMVYNIPQLFVCDRAQCCQVIHIAALSWIMLWLLFFFCIII